MQYGGYYESAMCISSRPVSNFLYGSLLNYVYMHLPLVFRFIMYECIQIKAIWRA